MCISIVLTVHCFKIHLLDHMMKYIEMLGSWKILGRLPFDQFNILLNHSYMQNNQKLSTYVRDNDIRLNVHNRCVTPALKV